MPDVALAARAELALERLAPLRFELAQTDAERDAALRLRCDCIVVAGWAAATDFPDGRALDADDDGATLVVCRDGGELVGGMRLVLPARDGPLPAEREFGVRARPAGRVAEVGRLVVAPGARAGAAHRIVGGLCARGWLELERHGCDRALSTATPAAIELYRAFGLRVTVLGPAREHWGERRAPVALDGDAGSFAFLTE